MYFVRPGLPLYMIGIETGKIEHHQGISTTPLVWSHLHEPVPWTVTYRQDRGEFYAASYSISVIENLILDFLLTYILPCGSITTKPIAIPDIMKDTLSAGYINTQDILSHIIDRTDYIIDNIPVYHAHVLIDQTEDFSIVTKIDTRIKRCKWIISPFPHCYTNRHASLKSGKNRSVISVDVKESKTYEICLISPSPTYIRHILNND